MDSYNFILQISFFISFSILIFIVASAIPRIPDSEEKITNGWIKKIPLKKIDGFIAESKDKTLRKAKIVILKVENFINKHLHKSKGDSGLGPKA